MKLRTIQIYLSIFSVLLLIVLNSCERNYKENIVAGENKIDVKIGIMKLEINLLTNSILNFRYYPFDKSPSFTSLSCIKQEQVDVKYSYKIKNGKLFLTTTQIKTEVDLNTGAIKITDTQNKLLFRELTDSSKILIPNIAGNDTGFSCTHRFALAENEAIYGFGQQQEGVMNYRGKAVELFQHNMKVAVPIMISSLGYGIFWDNYSLSKFHDSVSTSFWSEMGDGLNFYFFYGPEPDKVISGVRTLTGKSPMLPKWAFGLIQSRARYEDQKEILDVVKRYRELKVPLDLIVQDWQYWPNGWWGFKEFDPKRFPDPQKMLDQIHSEYNCHYMISIWPSLEPGSRDFHQMDSAGFLFSGVGNRKNYNVFNPAARDLFWKQTNEGLFKFGVDAWWCDATEPEINGWETTIQDYKTHMKPLVGSSCRYLNAYSLLQASGIYNGQRGICDTKRVVNLTRSAFAGQQRYSAITWSGDISANWETFHNQISAGLNFSITGIPYWTSDIGAFFVNNVDWFRDGIFPEGVKDPLYREFFVRWYQFGVFCPLFRVHGAQTPREIWHFGKPGEWAFDIQLKFNNLRYRLLPYIYSIAGLVTQEDYTIMRPLVMDFISDSAVYNINDQYMFGPAFLVNPVTKAKAEKRKVYLPVQKGGWYDFFTGIQYQGGITMEASCPIETLPLYVRAGSIVPMGPFLQYSGEKTTDPLEIRIYEGESNKFTLYEDEGNGYNYEKGEFCKIVLSWDDESKTLLISDAVGTYKGMPEKRLLKVVKVREGYGAGLDISDTEENQVLYEGKSIIVKL